MPSSFVRVRKHTPGGTIILDRPDRCNALTRTMIADLLQAFRDFHQQRSVRAVILTGAGSAFCAGTDLHELQKTSLDNQAMTLWHEDAVAYRELIETMLRFPKPIISVVNGPALATGAGLVLASDIVIAAQDGSIGMPEPHVGLVAGMVAPLLAFRVGAGIAANLLLTGRTADANEALRLGLFHEIVPDSDQTWARACEIAEQCTQSAPEAIQLTKRLLNETIGEHLGTILAAGAAASATAMTTEAAVEGLKAFTERRKPVWK